MGRRQSILFVFDVVVLLLSLICLLGGLQPQWLFVFIAVTQVASL